MRIERLLVIAGHCSGSFGLALTEAFVEAAQKQGREVRLLRLDQLQFDPILHLGYQIVQPLEPDLQRAQEDISWAQHVTIAYPIWWGSVPALLKGFLDRVLLPGYAFRYEDGKRFPTPLLKGRSANLLVTMDTPPWYYQFMYRAPGIRQMKITTLGFCGISPVKTTMIGVVREFDEAQRKGWFAKVRKLGAEL